MRVLVAPLVVAPLPSLVAPVVKVVAVVPIVLQIGLQQVAAPLRWRYILCIHAGKDCQFLCCRPGEESRDERQVRKPSAHMESVR